MQLEQPSSVAQVVSQPAITIVGRTRVDAVVTVNDSMVEPDLEGRFRQELRLEPGANIIEVVASLASGEQKSMVLTLVYLP